jgi:predicted dehydrogenase
MTPPPGTLGVGIIGAGFMGRTHAAAYLAASAAGLPVALVASTPDRDGVIPGDVPKLADAGALLARSDIHAVSICTYTDSHVELALEALAAGKHVLVEKPVALRRSEVERLAAAARHSGQVCMPAMCMRFWPGWPWLRERVLAGTFGAVRSAEFSRLSARPSWGVEFYADHRRSGGALFDLHIHDVDFIRWCFGDPATLASAGRREDLRTVYHFPSGLPDVSARGAWLDDPATVFAMRYLVRFEEAEIRFDLADSPPLRVLHGGTSQAVTLPSESAYESEVRHFVELVLARTARPIATLEEAAAVTGILEAEERSLASAGAVASPSPPR